MLTNGARRLYSYMSADDILTLEPDADAMKQPEILPLQEPTFFILLSLAPEAKHGYAILRDVEIFSAGRIRLSTGTLYGALSRLLDQDLIERVDEEEPRAGKGDATRADRVSAAEGGGGYTHPGRARKTYRLTRAGRRVLRAETARMQALVSAARRQLGEEAAG